MASVVVLQKLSASADFRDKLLKALQYSAKLAAALLRRWSRTRQSEHVPTLQSAAKTISTARRFVTLLRWVKYIETLREARDEPHAEVRYLLLLDFCLCTAVDALQDLVTLDRLGFFGKPNRLPVAVESLANHLDIMLAANGMTVTTLRLVRLRQERKLAHSKQASAGKVEAVVQAERLALLKYTCDLLKCLDSAGMLQSPRQREKPSSRPSGPEGLAAFAAVLSSTMSARKLFIKALK
ncbi:hypothetical protein AB1Y20_022996 [Prymnesium parvum]|uniref:Peroxisomal membrane protein PEX16 n=1 Tax=Prymnesium parvum TaxID=97485 RepID=A0AB34JE76_PRYPA